jgi:transcriptional regulator with XRE-family HTH domain
MVTISSYSEKKRARRGDVSIIFAARLMDSINDSGNTITSTATGVGLTQPTVTNYTNGTRVPKLDHLAMLAQFLNVSTDWLLGLSGTPTTDESMKTACKVTGLSEEGIETLRTITFGQGSKARREILELLLSSANYNDFIKVAFLSDTLDKFVAHEKLCRVEADARMALADAIARDESKPLKDMPEFSEWGKCHKKRVDNHAIAIGASVEFAVSIIDKIESRHRLNIPFSELTSPAPHTARKKK